MIAADRTNFTTVRGFAAGEPVEFTGAGGANPTVEDDAKGATVTIGSATVFFEGVRAADLPFGTSPHRLTTASSTAASSASASVARTATATGRRR